MRKLRRCAGLALALALLATAGTADAQQPGPARDAIGTPNRDVVLEIPDLRVDSLILEVDRLEARLSLLALVANLVRVGAGADVVIDSVGLELEGVGAEAYLYVDLDNVARIVDRVVTTLENNPEVLTRLLEVVDTAVSTVGGVAEGALRPGGVVSEAVDVVGRTLESVTRPGGVLSQTVDAAGRTVQRSVRETGQIVEHTADQAGRIVSSRTVGNVLDLEVVRETTGAAGGVVRRVRDAGGRIIEFTVDRAGRVSGARVIGG